MIQAQKLHSKLVEEVWARCFLYFLLVDNLFESLTLRKSQDVLGDMPEVNVLLE